MKIISQLLICPNTVCSFQWFIRVWLRDDIFTAVGIEMLVFLLWLTVVLQLVRAWLHLRERGSLLYRSRRQVPKKLWYLLTYSLTYLLTPWCRVLIQKLAGLQLVKKFPAFHGTLRFITTLTSARHPSGGVVYLRIVLSAEESSRMWVFLNNFFLQGGFLSTSSNPPSWRTTPRRLSATAY